MIEGDEERGQLEQEVCPVCGSSDIYYEMGGYVGKVYHCKVCGYVGALIVQADLEMIRAIREEYRQRER